MSQSCVIKPKAKRRTENEVKWKLLKQSLQLILAENKKSITHKNTIIKKLCTVVFLLFLCVVAFTCVRCCCCCCCYYSKVAITASSYPITTSFNLCSFFLFCFILLFIENLFLVLDTIFSNLFINTRRDTDWNKQETEERIERKHMLFKRDQMQNVEQSFFFLEEKKTEKSNWEKEILEEA